MEGDWVHERVVRFIAEHSGRTPDSIRPDEALVALDMDSLEGVELVMRIEDELRVEVREPVAPLVTVGDLVAFVRAAKPD